MAAPEKKNLQDLSGKWKMNRDISSDIDGVLQIQGFNVVMRKAIAAAPVYLHIIMSEENSHTKYNIDQKTTASIPAVNEEWITDWQMRDTEDRVMGKVIAKARWAALNGVEYSDFLAEGWLDEGAKQIEAFVESPGGGWTAHQIWGFEEIDGGRLFVRRVVVKKGEQIEKVKLVYNFESD